MLAYYEARAPEYDDWYLRRGRYERGPIHDAAWNAELDAAGRWLDELPIRGEIVELAAGTGWWSPLLASKGELSLYDAAAAPLDRARERLVAHRLRAHLHVRDAWAEPDRQVDALFTGFWLSHVPRARLAEFLAIVRRWLKPGGTFAFIDSLADPQSSAADHPAPADDRSRPPPRRRPRVHDRQGLLRAGASWRRRCAAAGFEDARVTTTGRFFLTGVARRAGDAAARRLGPAGAPGPRGYTPRDVPPGEVHDRDRRLRRHGRGDDRRPAPRRAGRARPGRRQPSAAGAARAPRARVRHPDRRRPTSRRSRAPTSSCSGSSPRCSPRSGARSARTCGAASSSCRVLAGATTAALTGILGHDQVVRSMPNTPARLGKGMTVWYATPDDDRGAARPGGGAARRARPPARGRRREDGRDGDRRVSGTGPTYVFLVMEALIDAAVHLGLPAPHRPRPRDRDARGLHALRQAVRDAPGRAAQHGHLAGRHVRRGAPRARVGPAPDGPVRGGLGGLSADRRARRPARGVASCPRPSGGAAVDRRRPSADASDGSGRARSTCAARRWRRSASRDLRAPERDLWADEAALWDRMQRAWAGLDDAAWHLPGAAPSDAGGPDWSLAEHVGHIADWLELAADYTTRAIETGEWPSDDDYDDGDFDTFNERRREPWASMPRDEILAPARGRPAAPARGRPAALARDDPRATTAWGWVYAASTATTSTTSRSSSRGPPNCVDSGAAR